MNTNNRCETSTGTMKMVKKGGSILLRKGKGEKKKVSYVEYLEKDAL